ncbi:hypothetical protein Bhyg_17891, partial [Pseudolycoriella hygida]
MFDCEMISKMILFVVIVQTSAHICHQTDPNISECLVPAIHDFRSKFKTGKWTEHTQEKSMDPLYFDAVTFGNGNSIKLKFTDVVISGLTSFTIKSLQPDLDRLTMDADVDFDYLIDHGYYDISLFGFIKLKGKFHGKYPKFSAKLHMEGEKFLKHGVEYFKFKTFNVKTEKVLSNLYGSNFFDTMLIRMAYPFVESTMSDSITKKLNEGIVKYPLVNYLPQ